jgi:LPXTG-motif cell wall-anchored protein
MQRKKLSKYAATLALALGCSAVTPAMAQDPNTAAPPTTQRADDDSDFGWIGLLGLIGLAGLMGRKRDTDYGATHRTTAPR